MSDAPQSYVAKTGLESMPVVWGDTALASAMGTSAMATGADSLSSANKSMNTAPEKAVSGTSWINDLMNGILGNVPIFSEAAKVGAIVGTTSTPKQQAFTKELVYAALFVVIGLMIISRGFGLIGEEGAGTLLELENPAKYPGIGHAIQGIKKGRKT
jgi:hypothetical protein